MNFNFSALANILVAALPSLPTVLEEVEQLATIHWGKDHVGQVAIGVAALNDIVTKLTPTAVNVENAVKNASSNLVINDPDAPATVVGTADNQIGDVKSSA